jgi:hypothetical protein
MSAAAATVISWAVAKDPANRRSRAGNLVIGNFPRSSASAGRRFPYYDVCDMREKENVLSTTEFTAAAKQAADKASSAPQSDLSG